MTASGILERFEAVGDPVPLVFDSPHSGDIYPADFGSMLPREMLRLGWDAHVDELFESAPDSGATLIVARFPRTYIDANRSLADIDLGMLDGPWPDRAIPGAKTRTGKGLVWRTVGIDIPIYDRRLSPAEVRNRIETCWRPYHRAVTTALDAAHARFGGVWHVNCHSMPSRWSRRLPEGADPVRSDFILGDRDGATCEPSFTAFVRETLAGMGYTVAVNDRLKGVEIVRRNGRPAENRHSLQIEINRARYMDETSFERNEGFDALKRDIGRLVAAISDHVRQRAGM